MKLGFYKKGLLFFAIILIFLTSSCKNQKQMSGREESLLTQEFHTKEIPLDSLLYLNDLLTYYDDQYCVKGEEYWPVVFLDMNTKKLVEKPNRSTIKVGLEPTPCVDGKIEFDDHMILEILKDGYNTEIEQVITEVDSIPSFVKKQFLSYGEDPNYAIGAYGNGVWICSKKDDELSNLNIYIYQVVIGFIESARAYSQLAYFKSIDELSEEEFLELKQEFGFHLSFKYTDEEVKFDFGY